MTDTLPVKNDDDRASDGEFENECIDLLCKQENTLSMLSEANKWDSLDLAKTMVVQFLDFAETHFDEEQLHNVGGRLHNVYQRTKDYERRLCGKTFNPLKRLVRMEVFTDEQARADRENLRAEYIELYRDFFAICVDRFRDRSATMDEFLQSVEMFISELERKW